jgi:hypothetical protein
LPIFPYYPLEMLQKLLSCDVELLKAPYMFDMVNAKESADERDIEKLLVEHITKYLLELLCKPLHKSSYANKFIMQSDLN